MKERVPVDLSKMHVGQRVDVWMKSGKLEKCEIYEITRTHCSFSNSTVKFEKIAYENLAFHDKWGDDPAHWDYWQEFPELTRDYEHSKSNTLVWVKEINNVGYTVCSDSKQVIVATDDQHRDARGYTTKSIRVVIDDNPLLVMIICALIKDRNDQWESSLRYAYDQWESSLRNAYSMD